MTADLFARAKGPRLPITHGNQVDCPWCGADCIDAQHQWREAVHQNVTACPSCGREFMHPGTSGDLETIGLLSPADMAYLAAKEKPHASR